MVFFSVDDARITKADFLAALERRGVKMCDIAPGQIRAVTHLGVTSEDIEHALDATQEILSA